MIHGVKIPELAQYKDQFDFMRLSTFHKKGAIVFADWQHKAPLLETQFSPSFFHF